MHHDLHPPVDRGVGPAGEKSKFLSVRDVMPAVVGVRDEAAAAHERADPPGAVHGVGMRPAMCGHHPSRGEVGVEEEEAQRAALEVGQRGQGQDGVHEVSFHQVRGPGALGDVVGRDVVSLEGLALGPDQRPVHAGRVVEGDVEQAREHVHEEHGGGGKAEAVPGQELTPVEERGALAVCEEEEGDDGDDGGERV